MKVPAIYRILCANTTDHGSSAGNNTHYNPRKHRTQNWSHSTCVEKERLHAYTKQCTESYLNICLYVFLLQIIIHIQVVTETEEVGRVMEDHVYAEN
jgi:hypothetical protein